MRITYKYAFILLLILFGLGSPSYAQWNKVFQFPTRARTIYFLDQVGHPEIGYAGLINGSIWQTTDYGITWQKKFTDQNTLSITDITFKNNSTGWFCTKQEIGQSGSSSVYRTTDGGVSWQNIMSDPGGEFTAIFYHSLQKILYLSEWQRGAFASTDDGDSWNIFSTENALNGYAFSDARNGILTFAGTFLSNMYMTNNGGVIWQHIFSGAQAWQPAAKPGTTTFFIFSEYNSTLTRADGIGFPWFTISTIGAGTNKDFTGCLRISACTGELYVQSAVGQGMYMSADDGVNWQAIGGPSNDVDTRFCIDGVNVFAGDKTGALWVKQGITDTIQISPQLTFFQFKKNSSVSAGKDTSATFSFRNDIPISVGLDSFAFDVSFNPNMLNLDSAGSSPGWKITSNKLREGLYHCIFYNSLHKDIAGNQPLSFFHFHSYLTVDTASTVFLKSGKAFFDLLKNASCLVTSTPQNNSINDSVIIHAADLCGDLLLRHFLATGNIDMQIISIHPNPASNEIAIETESSSLQDVNVIIYDDLGRECLTEKYSLQGKMTLKIAITSLTAGTYHILLKSPSGSVSSEFVKIH